MGLKKKIAKRLNNISEADEKKVVMTSDKYDEMKDEIDDDTVIKIVDEGEFDREGRGVEYGVNPEDDGNDWNSLLSQIWGGEKRFGEKRVGEPDYDAEYDIMGYEDEMNDQSYASNTGGDINRDLGDEEDMMKDLGHNPMDEARPQRAKQKQEMNPEQVPSVSQRPQRAKQKQEMNPEQVPSVSQRPQRTKQKQEMNLEQVPQRTKQKQEMNPEQVPSKVSQRPQRTKQKQEMNPEQSPSKVSQRPQRTKQFGEGNISDEGDVNIQKLQSDVKKFMDKLDLGQFDAVFAKIDKPIEKAELIAAFAERIGVPRAKLNVVLHQLKRLSKDVKPKMKKSDLVEYVLKK